MFSDAVENDVILKNPVTKAVKYNIGKEPKKVRALTVEVLGSSERLQQLQSVCICITDWIKNRRNDWS